MIYIITNSITVYLKVSIYILAYIVIKTSLIDRIFF